MRSNSNPDLVTHSAPSSLLLPRCAFSANLIFQDTVERVFVGGQYTDIPKGLYLIRGENVVMLGEVVSILLEGSAVFPILNSRIHCSFPRRPTRTGPRRRPSSSDHAAGRRIDTHGAEAVRSRSSTAQTQGEAESRRHEAVEGVL